MDPKPVLASKMIWVNGVTLLITAATALLAHDLVATNPKATLWIGAGVAALNIVLRLLTSQPLK